MALVSIDPKALEHACLCAGRSVHHFDRMGDDLPLRASIVAHARAIEREAATEARHAAELRELNERFSEVAVRVKSMLVKGDLSEAFDAIAPFILPSPDPLVEAVGDALEGQGMGRPSHTTTEITARLRAAIEARGGKIVWEAGE